MSETYDSGETYDADREQDLREGAVSPDLAEAADREVGADDETIVEDEGLSNRYAGERMTTARDFIDQELGAKGYPARQP